MKPNQAKGVPVFGRSLSKAVPLLSMALPFVPTGAAAIIWDESINGDLSNNQSAPTSFTLSSGVSSVVGSAGSLTADNQDWLHFTIPAGLQLTGMTPMAFVSSDANAFTGVQTGTAFVGSPSFAASFLGYTHINTSVLGVNLLPDMGTALGATGFNTSLPAGDY